MTIQQNDLQAVDFSQLIEHIPGIVFRFSHEEDDWKAWFVTRNVSMFGYEAEDFLTNRIRRMGMVHPDDRVLLSEAIKDYEAHGVNSFRLYYEIAHNNISAGKRTDTKLQSIQR